MTGTLAYPLQWPHGWPRSSEQLRSSFTTPFANTRDGIMYQLDMLGAEESTISTNIPLRRDGLPRVLSSDPGDTGVAVYFTLDGESRCIPCDKWDRVRDNMRAIEKTIEALRGIERWGADQMMQAAFSGFAALPPSASSGVPWWEVLGVESNASQAQVLIAYRDRIKETHPDLSGGNQEAFLRVQAAFEQYQGQYR